MTIKGFASSKGLTPQAVYQRLKVHCEQSGIDYKALKQPGSPELTEEGERILNALYSQDAKSDRENIKQALTISSDLIAAHLETETVKHALQSMQEERDALQSKIDQLTEEAAKREERIRELEQERDFLRLTVSQANELHAKALAMLQPAQTEKGLRAWIRKRFGKPESSTKTNV